MADSHWNIGGKYSILAVALMEISDNLRNHDFNPIKYYFINEMILTWLKITFT